jgi:hypothetical protein
LEFGRSNTLKLVLESNMVDEHLTEVIDISVLSKVTDLTGAARLLESATVRGLTQKLDPDGQYHFKCC